MKQYVVCNIKFFHTKIFTKTWKREIFIFPRRAEDSNASRLPGFGTLPPSLHFSTWRNTHFIHCIYQVQSKTDHVFPIHLAPISLFLLFKSIQNLLWSCSICKLYFKYKNCFIYDRKLNYKPACNCKSLGFGMDKKLN